MNEATVRLTELPMRRRDEIVRVAARYGARNVRVYGSAARGDIRPSSDLDFLVDLNPDRTLMDLGGLLMELQELLHVRVDIATEGMLRPKVGKHALADAIPL